MIKVTLFILSLVAIILGGVLYSTNGNYTPAYICGAILYVGGAICAQIEDAKK